MNLINPAWIDLRDLRFVSFELLVFHENKQIDLLIIFLIKINPLVIMFSLTLTDS
jgi:hypothetical protein